MTLSIPQHRDPVARAVIVVLALGLCWFAITGALPPAQAQEPAPQTIILIATPTLPASLPAPEIAAAPEPPTPAPVDPAVAAMPATAPASQLVRHADGSASLPGSEAWMPPQPIVQAAADPQLEIERAAAEAYRELPTAAAPSESNAQPNRARRPYTGR